MERKIDLSEIETEYLIPTYKRISLTIIKGEGMYVWDSEGKKYLDFLAGIATNVLGYSHPRLVKAICQQAKQLLHISNLFYIEPQMLLARKLSQLAFGGKCFFANSGAEANEGAIKLARRWGDSFSPPKFEIITLNGSFHGRTLATLTATAQEKYRKGFGPLVPGFKYADFNDLDSVKGSISDKTCAIMLEPIQGEGGINVGSGEFIQGLREICDERKILLIFDEVQCGLGRTGRWFAYQEYGVTPDIMTLAKALGGGVPISCMMARGEIASFLEPGTHATTFGGNPLSSTASLVTLKIMEEENLVENARLTGEYLKKELEGLKKKFSFIKEVRGKGLMLGMELAIPAKEIIDRAREKGLLIGSAGEKVLRFVPPLIIGKKEVDKGVEILREVLESVGK